MILPKLSLLTFASLLFAISAAWAGDGPGRPEGQAADPAQAGKEEAPKRRGFKSAMEGASGRGTQGLVGGEVVGGEEEAPAPREASVGGGRGSSLRPKWAPIHLVRDGTSIGPATKPVFPAGNGSGTVKGEDTGTETVLKTPGGGLNVSDSAQAYFPNVASAMKAVTFAAKDHSYLGGKSMTAVQISAALGAAYATVKLVQGLVAARVYPAAAALGVAVMPLEEPTIYEVDLEALGVSREEVREFLRADGAAQKDACESKAEYRAFCSAMTVIDRQLEQERSFL